MNSELKHGDWVFTCSMEPKQFDCFIESGDDCKHKSDFKTMDGASHSISHCGCKKVSEKYAKWFIENKIYEFFYNYNVEQEWLAYEHEIIKACDRAGIEYEGF